MEAIDAVNVVIISKEAKLFIAKRAADKPMPNKWEFPGGKVEAGESLEACALREIEEELDLKIIVDRYLATEAIEYEGKSFRLHLFTARLKEDSAAYRLHVHSQAAWVCYEELRQYDLPIAHYGCMQALEECLEQMQ